MKTREITIPEILNTQYRDYSMYVIEQRAIPSILDGLKPVMRRSLWIGMKLAKDWVKVSKLAGAAMALHPHGNTSLEDTISGNAQRFPGASNVPWFEGKGAFGSKITGPGNGIGAARYVSVKLSEWFYKILNVDHELIETKPSYDDSEAEPKSFLPLVPSVLLNPVQGIAVGFACEILPRKLDDIVHCQIQHLEGKGFREPKVHFEGFKGTVEKIEANTWKTVGSFKRNGKRQIIIDELPIGYNRESFIKILDGLEEKEIVSSFTDDCTDEFLFTVNLKSEVNDADAIVEIFKLSTVLKENLNVIGFDGKIRNMTVEEVIKEYTDYRFGWYLTRFKKQFFEKKALFEYERDLLKVIKTGLFKKFPDNNKKEIKELLLENGIADGHIDRIVQTPIYKFSKEEIEKLQESLSENKKIIEELVQLCKDEEKRKGVYMKELKGL